MLQAVAVPKSNFGFAESTFRAKKFDTPRLLHDVSRWARR